ncbi:phosphoribosylformylglycinamidine cyclo-ligase [Candidatus Micrarchaeota archaeon]|nr:phosphoribosylformylglycinamidine cyclo-ligase [Candidatus Micrarchaeota archaeon]
MAKKYSVNVKKVRGIQANINKRIFKGQKNALIGHYAGIFSFAGKKMAIHTDGVGTKVLVAEELEKYDTIGIDAVAMNVNDLICIGARPLAGVDYLAVAKEDPWLIDEIIKGLVKGANQSGINIVGGETAIMKDVIKGGKRPFDLAFTAVGVVEKLITGEKIKNRDVMIGLESSGLHSNGYTLARKALDMKKWGKKMLTPTKIYVKPVMEMVRKVRVNGIAHITGGAFSKLTRLNKKIGFFMDEPIKPKPIFNALWKEVQDEKEMYRTFNMGIGMVVVVPAREEDKVLKIAKKHKIKAQRIGEIIKESGVFLGNGTALHYER